ncbi:site-specific integrase [Pseudoalteromonas sp. CAL260-MNA-CIBAN-0059]|uniref:site-specific integrase n=1 Tax=Pseudoalteromonas sp. CAL260-MNA-CIBAN-0059 TaxID=3140430 RepID=UPI003330D4E1|tara:strand:- start:4711 stop:6036 length:1326 start_codon:yes stop_codon:yes gene_type:complete
MIVKNEIFSDGERRPLIINNDNSIDFWSTLYITVMLRADNKQNTIKNTLYSIILLSKWEQSNHRNLFEEFRDQKLLNPETIRSIKNFCMYSSQKNTRNSKKIIDFRRLAKKDSPLKTVDKKFQLQRMTVINNYLKFCAWEICKFKPNATDLKDGIDQMAKLFTSYYPKGISNISKVTHAEAITLEHFRQVAHAEHNDNPFKSFDSRLRNQILIEILYWTGCRPAEVIALQLDDIEHDIDEPQLRFIRRHDNIDDPRKDQPVLKTQERDIEIPKTLYFDLERYIRTIRHKYKLSKTHPYIFVSHKGQTSGTALSDKAFFGGVITPLKKVDADFINVQRRSFRIYFNERFSDQIDKHNEKISMEIVDAEIRGESESVKRLKKQVIRDGDEVDTRMRIMGHSNPNSARPYLDRHITRIANKVHKEMILGTSVAVEEIKNARYKK